MQYLYLVGIDSMIYKFESMWNQCQWYKIILRFVIMLMKASSDHQHNVEYATEDFKGVDSLRLQIPAIWDQFWYYNKFEMYL